VTRPSRGVARLRLPLLAVSSLSLLLTAIGACVISFPDPPETGGAGGRGTGAFVSSAVNTVEQEATSFGSMHAGTGKTGGVGSSSHRDPLARCNDELTDLLDDPDNCGTCGHMCQGDCVDGACVGDEL
jgi:hypothetical protein